MFTDRVTLSLSAGKGGNGVVAWRREKFIPKGGPAGGDGGNGGSIILEADPEIPSLEDFRNRRIIKAPNGQDGSGNNCKGKNGKDLCLKIPVGTLLKNSLTQEIIHDFTQKGERLAICKGGKGGKGNSRFKSPTHQAPLQCTPGTPGASLDVELELKLIADIGLVGMPNAGKSTLISHLAHIAVKIAPYPFTTLRPNLGLIMFDDHSRRLIADIPGIIEDAHQNRGLGLEFLRHVERCHILIFIIELSPWEETRDPLQELFMLRKELEAHNAKLLEKPFIVGLNKIDLEGTAELVKKFRERYPFPSGTLCEISAKEGTGCDALKQALAGLFKRFSMEQVPSCEEQA
jgi:GTP-binding protein